MSRFKVRYLQEVETLIDASDISDVINRLRAQSLSVEIISIQKVNLGSPMSTGDSNVVSTVMIDSKTGEAAAPVPVDLIPVKSKPKSIQRSSPLSKRDIIAQAQQTAEPAAHLDEDAVLSSLEKVQGSDVSGEDWAARALAGIPDSEVDKFAEPSAASSDDAAYTETLGRFGRATPSGRPAPKAIRRLER